jgi:hypothetical protein
VTYFAAASEVGYYGVANGRTESVDCQLGADGFATCVAALGENAQRATATLPPAKDLTVEFAAATTTAAGTSQTPAQSPSRASGSASGAAPTNSNGAVALALRFSALGIPVLVAMTCCLL